MIRAPENGSKTNPNNLNSINVFNYGQLLPMFNIFHLENDDRLSKRMVFNNLLLEFSRLRRIHAAFESRDEVKETRTVTAT